MLYFTYQLIYNIYLCTKKEKEEEEEEEPMSFITIKGGKVWIIQHIASLLGGR